MKYKIEFDLEVDEDHPLIPATGNPAEMIQELIFDFCYSQECEPEDIRITLE